MRFFFFLFVFCFLFIPSRRLASSTCPPHAASVNGDSNASWGMLTQAPWAMRSRATSQWPSMHASMSAVCISSVLCSQLAPRSSRNSHMCAWPL